VALEKDDFIGKEALAKIKTEGPKLKLCTFTIESDEPLMLHGSAPIIRKGEVLGVTTSSGYGYTIGENICYGYVSVEDASHDEGYEIEIYKEVYPARLEASRVLYDPERKRMLM
jgi:4-methylaminobutanoate oxidase (formaldehyde-forming)